MFIYWFQETRRKPLVYGVKASDWSLVFTWKFARCWNQRSRPLCKPKRHLPITTRYRLKRLCNALMNTVNFFHQKLTIRSGPGALQFRFFVITRFAWSVLSSKASSVGSRTLSFIALLISLSHLTEMSSVPSDSHKDFQNSVASSTLPNNISPLPSFPYARIICRILASLLFLNDLLQVRVNSTRIQLKLFVKFSCLFMFCLAFVTVASSMFLVAGSL